MRVAILGGSFDPVHMGHLQMAKYAIKHLPIDEVWFMPSKVTPLKDRKLTSFHDRLQMIKIAISPYKKMSVCTIEKELGDVSYTIDTINHLIKRYPHHEFSWIIGSDQAKQLDKWKDIKKLMELVPFYVFLRDTDELESKYPIHKVKMPLFHVSSTEIRNGEKLRYVVSGVRDYIGKHTLYLETMIACMISEHRYQHSVSVANLCSKLAVVHGEDKHKAYAMGLLHDVCKEWSYETSLLWMKHMDPEYVSLHKNIWHAYTASHFIKRYYHIYDKEILYAIRNHVIGSNHTKLAMILYVADKLDPMRGYDSSELIQLCEKDLKVGYHMVKDQQQNYLKRSEVNE